MAAEALSLVSSLMAELRSLALQRLAKRRAEEARRTQDARRKELESEGGW